MRKVIRTGTSGEKCVMDEKVGLVQNVKIVWIKFQLRIRFLERRQVDHGNQDLCKVEWGACLKISCLDGCR